METKTPTACKVNIVLNMFVQCIKCNICVFVEVDICHDSVCRERNGKNGGRKDHVVTCTGGNVFIPSLSNSSIPSTPLPSPSLFSRSHSAHSASLIHTPLSTNSFFPRKHAPSGVKTFPSLAPFVVGMPTAFDSGTNLAGQGALPAGAAGAAGRD